MSLEKVFEEMGWLRYIKLWFYKGVYGDILGSCRVVYLIWIVGYFEFFLRVKEENIWKDVDWLGWSGVFRKEVALDFMN